MEIDHLFLMVDPPGDRAAARLTDRGLRESYRRRHPGQGTENVCYCFDNLYLELLWISDADEAAGPAIRRTGLLERAGWRDSATNPFGIAWRNGGGTTDEGIVTWPYTPPYLPPGMSIPVAVDGDAPDQPMMFRSPGSSPAASWAADRRGGLQHEIGLTEVREVILEHPSDIPYCAALEVLAANTILRLAPRASNRFRLELRIERNRRLEPRILVLPDLIWRET